MISERIFNKMSWQALSLLDMTKNIFLANQMHNEINLTFILECF